MKNVKLDGSGQLNITLEDLDLPAGQIFSIAVILCDPEVGKTFELKIHTIFRASLFPHNCVLLSQGCRGLQLGTDQYRHF